jgi:hypothetical protein
MIGVLCALQSSCVSAGGEGAPPRKGFAGSWLTDDKAHRRGGFFGKLTLVQEGSRVTGLFADDQWSLEGTVTGRKLTGRWWWNSVGDASFEETVPEFRGVMEWTLSEDGDAFTGWGLFHGGLRDVWTGRRVR